MPLFLAHRLEAHREGAPSLPFDKTNGVQAKVALAVLDRVCDGLGLGGNSIDIRNAAASALFGPVGFGKYFRECFNAGLLDEFFAEDGTVSDAMLDKMIERMGYGGGVEVLCKLYRSVFFHAVVSECADHTPLSLTIRAMIQKQLADIFVLGNLTVIELRALIRQWVDDLTEEALKLAS
jgi:hypothetical protein